MSTNPLNDISRVYLEKVAIAEEKEKPKFWWDDDGDRRGYEKGEVSGKFKRKKKKVEEANDGNLANNYPPYDKVTRGDVIAGATGKDQMGGKKKKVTKEGYSNWREELSEVAEYVSKDNSEEKITEKKVKNKIKINPTMGEAVENLGGTLLEMNEIENFEGVFDELSESEIFLLSDELIEEVVEEFFHECIEEGYGIEEVENTLLESLEISSALLNEARVTYGHDTDVKSDRLEKVKTAVKNTGKKLVRGAGYVAGLAVRGAKAVGRELKAGYKRGRDGASGSSSSSSESSSGSGSSRSSGSSSSSSGSSSGSGSSRPGLLGRIGSALKSGLKRVIAKGARKVARGALGVARRMEKEKPSAVHSKAGVRSASPRSGIGGGKKVEVAGERKKEQPVQKVSVADVTPKKSKAPEGTSENPRVGQPGKDKPKPTVKTRKTSTKGFGSFKPTQSGEEAYQREKEKQETSSGATRTRSSGKRKPKEPNPKKPGKPSLDDLLKSEEVQIDEKTLTDTEKRKKEEVFKSVTLDKLKKQYPEKSPKELEALRYAISTSMAKKIAEQAMEMQPKVQKPEQNDQQQRKVAQQKDRQRQQEIQILNRKLQALRSAPKGSDTDVTV